MGINKLPILIEISVGMQKMIDDFSLAQLNYGITNATARGNNVSFVLQTALARFHMALKKSKVTREMLAEWEEGYREHRSAPRRRTTATVAEPVVELMPDIASMILSIDPDLRHVYHGDAVNAKLIAFFAFSYVANYYSTG